MLICPREINSNYNTSREDGGVKFPLVLFGGTRSLIALAVWCLSLDRERSLNHGASSWGMKYRRLKLSWWAGTWSWDSRSLCLSFCCQGCVERAWNLPPSWQSLLWAGAPWLLLYVLRVVLLLQLWRWAESSGRWDLVFPGGWLCLLIFGSPSLRSNLSGVLCWASGSGFSIPCHRLSV